MNHQDSYSLSDLLYMFFVRVKSENYMIYVSIIKYIFLSYQSIINTYQKAIKALIAFYLNISMSELNNSLF